MRINPVNGAKRSGRRPPGQQIGRIRSKGLNYKIMGTNHLIKREDFVKDFMKIVDRVLLRELPEKGTNEDLIRQAYNSIYIRVRHINEGCRAISQPRNSD